MGLNNPGAPAGSWQLQSTTILSAATAAPSIAIPGGFADCRIVVDRMRSDRAGQNNEQVQMEFNNDSTAGHYIWSENRGQGAGITNTGNSSDSVFRVAQTQGATSAANYVSDIDVTVWDYAGVTNFKNIHAVGTWANGDGTNISREMIAGVWTGAAAAVASAQFKMQNGSNFVTGTRFRVYCRN